MMEQEKKAYPTTGINRYVTRYLKSLQPAYGSIALDIPSGDGRASAVLRDLGMQVIAYDLFPETFRATGLQCQYADMTQPLPLGDEAVDMIVCQEGIEHVPNQLAVLEEFNRVLKPGGTLLLTTPNSSHIRARVSTMLVGNVLLKYLPSSEVDSSIWWADHNGNMYFGHLFLLDVHHLRGLARITGFDIAQTLTTDVSTSSVLLGVFVTPLMMVGTLWAYYGSSKKHNARGNKAIQALLQQQVKLHLSPKTLFCKHIFWVLTKREALANCRKRLQHYARHEAAGIPFPVRA